MSEVSAKAQEEYEDDFEKDLDWLISEEDQGPDYEDIKDDIDKELGEEEGGVKEEEKVETEERWPSPMEPLDYDSDRDGPGNASSLAPPSPALEDQSEEEKKYILEKIQRANRELQDQEAPDVTRHRRLHFKDTLVDLVVPPLEYKRDGSPCSTGGEKQDRSTDVNQKKEAENDMLGRLSELKISPSKASRAESGGAGSGAGGAMESSQEGKEGRVLVEKDGKFDLVSLKELESQGLLPPLAAGLSDSPQPPARPTHASPGSSLPPRPPASASVRQPGQEHLHIPRPPAQKRPNSAVHSHTGSLKRDTHRRVQSATGTPCLATYTLTPQQKELLQRIQERKERLAREAEHKKHEEEEHKRQENETAFRAWMVRKREQLQEEKRILRAREMERLNCTRESSDPDEAFRTWLQRKQEQQQRDRRQVELRRLEQENSYMVHNRAESERAFKLWLQRKRAEKRLEQQVTRERSRRLVLEERRARRIHDLLFTVNEAKPFRFSEHLAYRF